MAVLVQELLDVWREAERVLDRLPESEPWRDVLASEVAELRVVHQRLADQHTERSARLIRDSVAQIESARQTLAVRRSGWTGPDRRGAASAAVKRRASSA
jgi:hypothetical protein